jgi:hypothetical protein
MRAFLQQYTFGMWPAIMLYILGTIVGWNGIGTSNDLLAASAAIHGVNIINVILRVWLAHLQQKDNP